jgi:hypothetical protein
LHYCTSQPASDRVDSGIGPEDGLEIRTPGCGNVHTGSTDELDCAVLVPRYRGHGISSLAPDLGGRGDGRQGVDPRGFVQNAVVGSAEAGRGLGVSHALAVTAQPNPCGPEASAGVSVRRVEPDRFLEIADRQQGRVLDQVQLAPVSQQGRLARPEGQGLSDVLDRAGEVVQTLPRQLAELVDLG